MSKPALEFKGLESNPEVLTEYCHSLGLKEEYQIFELFGLGLEELSFVPKPVYAVILLFPDSFDDTESRRKELSSKYRVNLQVSPVYYLRQVETLGDACGTVALFHACLNNRDLLNKGDSALLCYFPLLLSELNFIDSKFLSFYQETEDLDSVERGDMLSMHEDIHAIHAKFAEEGDTEMKNFGETAAHYICFVRSPAGDLLELDGMLNGPIKHGEVTQDNLLNMTIHVIQTKFISSAQGSLSFSVLAICPTS